MSANVIIYHSPLAADAPADELDVLDQVDFFQHGLQALGYRVISMPFPYNMQLLPLHKKVLQPLFVVNLVETLFANGQLIHLAPALFAQNRLSYTGSPADSIYITSNKILAKQVMRAAGIPTPDCILYDEYLQGKGVDSQMPWLLKSIWEHASFGMDENQKLLHRGAGELAAAFAAHGAAAAGFFAEAYIEGREFNLSVLGSAQGPVVLPLAEIQFHYPPEKPKIVGYKAKWEEDSFEYQNTIRVFENRHQDSRLFERLRQLALQCWQVFGLKGYARVDFRVDEKGQIFVLEINANPCIAPDSGFVAAAGQAGLDCRKLVGLIVEDRCQ